jgi:hypothetical protein
MPTTPESELGTPIHLRVEDVLDYLANHSDAFRKETEKRFKYVRDNYALLKPHIDAQVTSLVVQWVAEGLGGTYEDVATLLDEKTIKQLLGEEWYKF